MSEPYRRWLFGDVDVESDVLVARALVTRAKELYAPKVTISLLSGGNDSTILFHLTRDMVDYVAHIDTGTGIPETRRFVEETTKQYGVPLLIEETPPALYESMVLERGFPGPGMHFKFYSRLKERRLDDLKRRFVGRRGKERILFLTGLRKSESKRRKLNIGKSGPIHPAAHSPRMIFCNPIQHFTPETLGAYRERHAVPRNPVADLIHMSGECLCGAFAKPDELKEIAFWYPAVGERIRALEEKARQAGVKYCKWGHGGGDDGRRAVGVLCQSCELFPGFFAAST